MASHDVSAPMAAEAAQPVSKWALHRRLYNWVLSWAETRYGLPVLMAISFIESSVFPIPPDVLLIPLVLAATTRWVRLAFWCTVASVLGGMFGYAIGYAAWETVGTWIVENLAHVELTTVDGRDDIAMPGYLIKSIGAERLGGEYLFQVYDHWNAWIVFIFGLTPLPYKLVTVTAGVAQVNLIVFTIASIASRGLRFFVVAWIIKTWGPPARVFVEKYFNLLAVLFTLLLVGGFAVLKFVL
ncbi:YqaA family protein [Tautonia rosea]|uniref:YqaA family protein n=1 Tax=Tautonia rosea TaxID=2728037 RepID=UPI0019D1C43C|nr:YqaA family protein [Tautonia rosea]